MISINGLKAKTGNQQILNGVDLTVKPGETHVIMGPNGAGKSTLSKLIAAHPDYDLTAGEILFKGNDIKDLSTEERAQQGIFLGFQYPTEIPGVNNLYFLRAAYNAKRTANGEPLCDAVDFMRLYKEKAKLLEMDKRYQTRSVNAGFSGGEKKRNEILQMLILEPELAVLDETDSGLDIDALKIISTGINLYRNAKRSIVLITHYQRLLDYIKPDYVHVMLNGRIVKSGGPELALQLEKQGYSWLEETAAAEAL